MKAIAYSLFGVGQPTPKNSFEFSSYMRGLMINVRVNRILYPNWINVVHTDKETYTSKYQPIFDWLIDKGFIDVAICPSNEKLTMAMLWRLKPVFEMVNDQWKYTHVLCRDIDSVATYRELQAVTTWIIEDKTIHCITDSISHNVAMMGGMIGIRPHYFGERVQASTWQKLIEQSQGIDFSQKGADQTFLNKYVYPRCADSATEHFILGMVRNLAEGNGRHYTIEEVSTGVDNKFRVVNEVAGHIGAAGYYENIMVKFLNTMDPYKAQYLPIESQFPQLFFWNG